MIWKHQETYCASKLQILGVYCFHLLLWAHELIYVVSTPELHQWLHKNGDSVSRNIFHLRRAGLSTYFETIIVLEQLSCDGSCIKSWGNSAWYIHKNISIFFYIHIFPSTSCCINQSEIALLVTSILHLHIIAHLHFTVFSVKFFTLCIAAF